jgi:hypothetical protein
MLAVYTYSDASGIQRNAESDEFNFVGTWSSTGTYSSTALDTVNYSASQFTCIVDNVGYNPQAQPAKWSPRVLRQPATGIAVSFGSEVAIPSGTNWLTVTGLNLAYTPVVVCSVVAPSAGNNLYATVVGSPTSTGFAVALSGTTNSSGYALDFIAHP